MKTITLFLSAVMLSIASASAECLTETFSSPDIVSGIVCPGANGTAIPKVPQTYTGDNGIRWTYWLGGGNTEAFGEPAMYMRARKSDENCDFGYLMSDSIEGGLSAISFQWKQGGVESGWTYDIKIYANEILVGTISQKGVGDYTATTAEPFEYSQNHLNIEGRFVLKIVNESAYTGTGNKIRMIINDLSWCGYTDPGEKEIPDFSYTIKNISKTVADPDFIHPLTSNTDGKITYTSSDPACATVGTDGRISIVDNGTTVITASADETDRYVSATASYTLTVARIEPDFAFSVNALYKEYGDPDFINPLHHPSDAKVTYRSSDETVATVDRTGNVTIAGKGAAVITASTDRTPLYEAAEASYALIVMTPGFRSESFGAPAYHTAINTPGKAAPNNEIHATAGDNGITWEYWLASANREVFPGDTAMYLRGRYNESDKTGPFEGYGYCRSDSIEGGCSEIALMWKQGGNETFDYHVDVMVNNEIVGTVTASAQATYQAQSATPRPFYVGNLTCNGKIVLSVVNRSAYAGTSNKARIVFNSLNWNGYSSQTSAGIGSSEPSVRFLTTTTRQKIDIQAPAGAAYTVNLYNQIGTCVCTHRNTGSVDVSALSAGLYIGEIVSESGRTVTKIIIK